MRLYDGAFPGGAMIKITHIRCAVFLLAALLLSPHAFAQAPQGFNSTGDYAPFGAHGQTVMDIYSTGAPGNGAVGIGMAIKHDNGAFDLGRFLADAGVPGEVSR